jgi:CopG-like RHH_1 or ribbon-helix-helix domain, RHH_5
MIGERTVTLTIPESTHTALRKWADKEGRTRAEQAAHIITQAIATYTATHPYNPAPGANPHRQPLATARAALTAARQRVKHVLTYEKPLRTAAAHGWAHDHEAATQAAVDLADALMAQAKAEAEMTRAEALFVEYQRTPRRAP